MIFMCPIVSKSLLIVLGTLSKARHELTVRSADARKLKRISAHRKPHFSQSLYCLGNLPAVLLDVISIQQRGRCGRSNSFMLVVMPAHTTRLSVSINMVNRSTLLPCKELTERSATWLAIPKMVEEEIYLMCSRFSPSLHFNGYMLAVLLDGVHAETARVEVGDTRLPPACLFHRHYLLPVYFRAFLFYRATVCPCQGSWR